MWEICHCSWKVSGDCTCKKLVLIDAIISQFHKLFTIQVAWNVYSQGFLQHSYVFGVVSFIKIWFTCVDETIQRRFRNSLKFIVNWSVMLYKDVSDRTFYFCKRGGQVLPGGKAPWSPGCVTEGGHTRDMQIRIFILGHIIDTKLLYFTIFLNTCLLYKIIQRKILMNMCTF